jgi:hypothetical protein
MYSAFLYAALKDSGGISQERANAIKKAHVMYRVK